MGKLIKTYSTYEISVEVAAVAAGAVVCQIAPPVAFPTLNRVIALTQLTVVSKTAVASSLGLAFAATKGTAVPANVNPGILVSKGNWGVEGGTGPGELITGWTVQPAPSGSYLRSEVLPAVLGSRFQWTWPEDDPFGAGESVIGYMSLDGPGVLLQNTALITASPILSISARWLEFSVDQL